MAKSRGRDVSITRGTLPLNTTRYVGITPLGVSYASPTIVSPSPTRSYLLEPSVTPLQPASGNRLAKTATRNDNLYRPAPITKEIKVCADRSVRREVIFATGKGGRNGMKKARHTPNSKVKCT